MILVIGGACQGKRNYARGLLGLSEEDFSAKAADGRKDEVQRALDGKHPYLLHFHEWIRKMTEQERPVRDFVEKVLEMGPEIIVMDEVGLGIVPTERTDRDYREAVGQAGQMLAAEAEQVYRVICGIPQKIKGADD